MHARSRLNRLITAALAAITIATTTPRVEAQFGMMGMGSEIGDLVKPSNNARLLKQYAEILSLSPEQKRAADELLMAYQAEFRDNVSRLEEIYQSINEEVQETGDYEVYQTVLPTIMVKFMRKSDTLNKTFMSDLQTLLDSGQAARFPLVERLHRRSSSIKMGLEGVQRLDLVQTLTDLGGDAVSTPAIASALEQYANDMDREIVARDKMIRDFVEEMAKQMDDGKNIHEDPTQFQKWMKDMMDAGKRLEDINTRYISQVRSSLPEAAQQQLDAEVKLTKYPAIYKGSYASRIFAALEKMTDLDAAQQEGLKTLKETYLRNAQTANDKWASVLDGIKAGMGEEAMMGGGSWMIRQDPKYTEAREARKAVDDKAVESVKALLTEAQRAKLPKKNYRPEWDFDRAIGQ